MTLVPGAFRPKIEIIDFTRYDKEAILFDAIMSENVDIAGFKINYYIHDPQNVDKLYGEDPLEGYRGPFETKIMYAPEKEINLVDGFGSVSGLTIVNAEFTKTTFTRDCSGGFISSILSMPKAKDVIKTLWNNKLYEITDVTDENKVFIGNKLIWTVTLSPFRYGEQSDSAAALLYSTPTSADMPLRNRGFDTLQTSAYGDNADIEIESLITAGDTSVISDPDQIYGYNPFR